MSKKFVTICVVAGIILSGCVAPVVSSVPASNQGAAAAPVSRPASNAPQSIGNTSTSGSQASNQSIGSQPSSQSAASPSSNQSTANNTSSTAASSSTVDLTHLPIGDGHVSTQPEVGYVWSCQTSFNGGGAAHIGDWVNSDGTFNLTAKPTVDGSVNWPSSFTISLQGDQRVISSNDLPNHATGTYPISSSDGAYAYDRNPNSISAQNVSIALPANPTLAAQPSCVGMGPIGVLLTGSYLFNALDAAGRDAVAHEVQDSCQGHPEKNGAYHYHDLTSCLNDPVDAYGNSALVGYAIDGFGIYGPVENGVTLTSADLDECHGRTSEVEWDGQRVTMYHYVATADYPYTIGCFRGTPIQTGQNGNGPAGGQTQPNGNVQPQQNGGQQAPQFGLPPQQSGRPQPPTGPRPQ